MITGEEPPSGPNSSGTPKVSLDSDADPSQSTSMTKTAPSGASP